MPEALTVLTKQPTPTQAKVLQTANDHPDLSTRQIGAIADCSHVNVINTLRRYGVDHGQLESYKAHKADIVAGMAHRILAAVTDEDIQKAPMGSKILAVAQLIDKEQTLRGLSNMNIAIIHADIAALRAVDKPVDE